MDCDGGWSSLEIWGMVAIFFAVLIGMYILVNVAEGVYKMWIGPALGCNINVADMGKWAVITGSTDGIGKAIAHEIAKRDVNVVLISRSPSKLQAVAEEIERLYNVYTKTIAVDFTGDYDIYEDIRAQLTGLEIGALFNNVGIMPRQISYIHKEPDLDNFILNTIRCNIFSMQFMTNMILPQMVARRKGLIVNISSLLSIMPCPFLGVYAATKAYVSKFSSDLSLEYSKSGVHIQCALPGGVATHLNFGQDGKTGNIRNPSPKVYAHALMRSLGMATKTSAYFPHSVMGAFFGAVKFLLPETTKKVVRTIAMATITKDKLPSISSQAWSRKAEENFKHRETKRNVY